jgi:hypothetical protein
VIRIVDVDVYEVHFRKQGCLQQTSDLELRLGSHIVLQIHGVGHRENVI